MINNHGCFFISLSVLVSLGGCVSSGEADLRDWMAQERANVKPVIKPLDEPKTFKPESYTSGESADPFNRQRLLQVLRKESAQTNANAGLIAPELNRRKEPLEAEPLDSMMMVGSLNKKKTPTALVRVGGLLYQVHLGNYLGQNYGKITQISENFVRLREIVQDGTGDWIERTSTLELQEGRQ